MLIQALIDSVRFLLIHGPVPIFEGLYIVLIHILGVVPSAVQALSTLSADYCRPSAIETRSNANISPRSDQADV